MLARWNFRVPDFYEEVDRMHRQMNRFLAGGKAVDRSGVYPPVNVYDDGEAYLVRCEAPGLDPSAIDVTVTEKVLTIKGERKQETDSEKRAYHRRERGHGYFSRSLTLPKAVDPENIKAGYTHGILEIVLPKAESTKPRKITVNA